MDLDAIMTTEEAARWLKIEIAHLNKLARQGKIPSFFIGHKTRRFHPRTILAHLAAKAGVPAQVIATALQIPKV